MPDQKSEPAGDGVDPSPAGIHVSGEDNPKDSEQRVEPKSPKLSKDGVKEAPIDAKDDNSANEIKKLREANTLHTQALHDWHSVRS